MKKIKNITTGEVKRVTNCKARKTLKNRDWRHTSDNPPSE